MTNTTELKKWGNSQAVRLPKSILTQAGIGTEPTTFDVTVNSKKEIILTKKKSPESLKDLFEGFDYKKYWDDWNKEHPNESKEFDLGDPVGRELL